MITGIFLRRRHEVSGIKERWSSCTTQSGRALDHVTVMLGTSEALAISLDGRTAFVTGAWARRYAAGVTPNIAINHFGPRGALAVAPGSHAVFVPSYSGSAMRDPGFAALAYRT